MALTSEKTEAVLLFTGVKHNFQFWQARVRALLMQKDVHGALTRTKDQTETAEEKTAANKACSVILRRYGDVPLAAVIKHADDPKAIWNALAARFVGVSTFNKESVEEATGWSSG